MEQSSASTRVFTVPKNSLCYLNSRLSNCSLFFVTTYWIDTINNTVCVGVRNKTKENEIHSAKMFKSLIEAKLRALFL